MEDFTLADEEEANGVIWRRFEGGMRHPYSLRGIGGGAKSTTSEMYQSLALVSGPEGTYKASYPAFRLSDDS